MRLVDLNPQFFGGGGEGISLADGSPAPERTGLGIDLDCPCGKCGRRLSVPFANPLDGGTPSHPRGWQRTGETFDALTLTPSILRRDPTCGWHGYITNGEIITV